MQHRLRNQPKADIDLRRCRFEFEIDHGWLFCESELPERFLSEPLVLTIEFTAKLITAKRLLCAPNAKSPTTGKRRARITSPTPIGRRRSTALYALRDDDGDMTINAYDWTPRGEASDFDLRVVGGVTMDGSENRPYPVYNIWQLQAIDGVVPAEATAALLSDVASASHAAGQTLYGADPTARLTAAYRLEFDIDATPTRDWNSGSGFDPIGGSFSGVFDGGGNVVRGLRINSADSTVGLFAEISSSGGRVQDVGLENASVKGADMVGAIAGSLGDGGELRSVWVHGRVTGGSQVGGLAGSNVNSTITSSWFAGQVRGNDLVGGLAGTVSASNARMLDSWAAVDIFATMTHAGELAGEITDDALLEHLWGEGFLSSNSRPSGGVQTNVHYDDIRALSQNQLGGDSIWNVGATDVDFPILTVHSQNLQGAAIAAGLTRIIGVNGATTATLTLDASVEQTLNSDFAAMRLEANTGDVPALDCDFADGALRAQTGFNGASVIMTVISRISNQRPRWRLATRGGCDVNWVGNFTSEPVTLRLIFVSRADPGAPETRLTTDYPLQTPSSFRDFEASPLFVSLPARVTLPALASMSAPALTVTVAGPGTGGLLQIDALPEGDFAVAQQIATTFLATVSLARAATAIFDSDNPVDVTFNLTHRSGSASAIVTFVSTPRPIDAPPRTFVTVASEIAAGGQVLVADTPPSIWHLDNTEERYTLAGLNAALFVVNGDDGSVQVGSNAISGESYEFELQLIGGGVTARQSIYVNLFTDANAAFLSTATMGWSAANAYDYEFEANGGAVKLNVVNGVMMDGTAEKPWPIYNIWQLQAIAGISVSINGGFSERNNFLGDDNLGGDGHYQLMNDIDATVTREWGERQPGERQTLGFYPIPDFSGGFDGGGRVISGLYINNSGDDVGLFAQISGGRVASVGLDAVRIVGGETSNIDNVGAIAGEVRAGEMVEVWAIGRVESRGGRAGGLIGGDDGASAFSLDRGWFAGEVIVGGGSDGEGGGLLGGGTDAATPQISDSWAMARVTTGGSKGGGLVGEIHNGGALRRVWAGGAAAGGLLGEATGMPTIEFAYWDVSTSGQNSSADGFGISLTTALTLSASALDESVWTAGDDNDYPILEGSDDWKNWQRLGLARGLTRLYGAIGGGDSVPLTVDMTVTFSETGNLNVSIDVDGETDSTPTCTAKSPGGVVNMPKYNGVSIEFVALDNGGNSIGTNSNCSIDISGTETGVPYTIVVTFTVGEGASQKTIERRYLIMRP